MDVVLHFFSEKPVNKTERNSNIYILQQGMTGFMKKNCTYPIAFEAIKYFNHPEFMIRTSVMNIILELMKSRAFYN